MTGGSLPAMTWQQIMARAPGHRAADLAGPEPAAARPPRSRRSPTCAAVTINPAGTPIVLTRRGADILVRIEQLMDDATRALAARDTPENRADANSMPRRCRREPSLPHPTGSRPAP